MLEFMTAMFGYLSIGLFISLFFIVALSIMCDDYLPALIRIPIGVGIISFLLFLMLSAI